MSIAKPQRPSSGIAIVQSRRAARLVRGRPAPACAGFTGPTTHMANAVADADHLVYPFGIGAGFRLAPMGSETEVVSVLDLDAAGEHLIAPNLGQSDWSALSIVAWWHVRGGGHNAIVGLEGDDTVFFRARSGGNIDLNLGIDALANAPAAWVIDTWYHSAGVWGGDGQPDEGMEVFHQGVSIATSPTTTQAKMLGGRWLIGRRDSGSAQLDGMIAQLLIFPVRLTLAQYQALYNGGAYLYRDELCALVEAGTVPAPEVAYLFGV